MAETRGEAMLEAAFKKGKIDNIVVGEEKRMNRKRRCLVPSFHATGDVGHYAILKVLYCLQM